MDFPFFDYLFQSDPFEFNFRLLILNGFWPLDTKNRVLQTLCTIYSFLCYFSPVSMFFIQILDLYLLRNDPFTFTKNMCATSVTFAAVVKQILIFYKIEHVEELHQKLVAFRKSRVDVEDLIILEKADRMMSKTTKTMYSLAIPCITAWMLYPGLEFSKQKGVPFPYRLPTDDWSTPVYEILYIYQSFSMVGFMVMILSNDLVYYSLIIRINAKYEMLMKKFEKLNAIVNSNLNNTEKNEKGLFNSVVTERVRLLMKDCFVFHQNILKDVDKLKMIYENPYLIHFFAAVALVGSIIIDIVVVSKGFKLQILQRIMYSANGLFDTFLCCFFTTIMQEQSYKLSEAIYSTPWYKISPEIRKDLLMISIMSLKAPAVRIGNYYPLNLTTFLQFLKISYNITALLYQTIRR